MCFLFVDSGTGSLGFCPADEGSPQAPANTSEEVESSGDEMGSHQDQVQVRLLTTLIVYKLYIQLVLFQTNNLINRGRQNYYLRLNVMTVACVM